MLERELRTQRQEEKFLEGGESLDHKRGQGDRVKEVLGRHNGAGVGPCLVREHEVTSNKRLRK